MRRWWFLVGISVGGFLRRRIIPLTCLVFGHQIYNDEGMGVWWCSRCLLMGVGQFDIPEDDEAWDATGYWTWKILRRRRKEV